MQGKIIFDVRHHLFAHFLDGMTSLAVD